MLDKRVFWRPLLISPNSSIRKPLIEGLCKRLPPSEHTVLSEYQSADRVLELVSTINANLCLVDVSTDECRALALVRELTAKELTVVVLHTSDDSGLILRCLRCGAHEFLFPPFEPGSTWAVLDELAARRCSQSGRALGSVYVVLPSKPNIGSTTVATSLAVRAVEEHGKPILLADLDPLYGSVQFLLKTKGNFTFIDAFSTWSRMDSELWSRYVVRQSGIDILLAPDEPVSLLFKAPPASEFLGFLRNRYSAVFLDIPGLLTEWYGELAAAADSVLLVTTNELMAIHTARRAITCFERAAGDVAKVKLIVNRYLADNGLTCEAIETALRTRVFCTLPNDYAAVQKAVFDGKPLGSGSPLGDGLDELCRRLMGKEAPSKPGRFWSSLLSLSKGVSSSTSEGRARKKDAIVELGL